MDALAGQVTERLIDPALPFQSADPGKGGGFDLDRKMAFARSIIAQMAVMFGTVIGHDEPRWRKAFCQAADDFGFDGSVGHGDFFLGNGFSSSTSLAMGKSWI